MTDQRREHRRTGKLRNVERVTHTLDFYWIVELAEISSTVQLERSQQMVMESPPRSVGVHCLALATDATEERMAQCKPACRHDGSNQKNA
jgi:hypothetical protein